MTTRFTALALVALLAACSGGGDGGGGTPAVQATPESEPNGTYGQANALTIGTPVTGTISIESDQDWYVFTVPAGGADVRFQTFDSGGTACDPTNGRVDPFIEVYDATGTTLLGGDDDSGLPPYCENLTLHLAAGTNYVMVGGWWPTPFTYILKVTIP